MLVCALGNRRVSVLRRMHVLHGGTETDEHEYLLVVRFTFLYCYLVADSGTFWFAAVCVCMCVWRVLVSEFGVRLVG